MSKKIEYGNGCKYINKKKNLKFMFGNFFYLLLILIGVLFLIFNVLSIVNINNLYFNNRSVKINDKFYLLNFGDFKSLEQAEKLSQNIVKNGAGGYVWKDDNGYYVIGFCYNSEEDAKVVIKNMNSNQFKLSIKKIEVKKYLTFNGFTKEEFKIIKNSINCYKNYLNGIYSNCLKLDKKQISYSYLINVLQNYYNDFLLIFNNLTNCSINNKSIVAIKNLYIKTCNNFRISISKLLQESNKSYVAKFLYLDCVYNYFKL